MSWWNFSWWNQEDIINKIQESILCIDKPVIASSAVSKRLTKPLLNSIPSLASDSSVPSLNVSPQKLQDCPKECDKEQREAKFAFRKTDLESWKDLASASPSSAGGTNANSDPIRLQHWAVVIHFPEGDLTFVFEAYNDAGKLEGYRARFVDKEVFEKAKYFGTADTCPLELFDKAKQVKSNGTKYNLANNNCQTWLEEFLKLISPELYQSLDKMIVELQLADEIGWFLCAHTALVAAHYYFPGTGIVIKIR